MENENAFERQLFSITTIIISSVTVDGKTYSSQGSGFYYTEQTPAEEGKEGPQWYRLDKFWLVTNRHVIVSVIDEKEYLPDTLSFGIRESVKGEVKWKSITLSKSEIASVLKLHKDKEVDVAVLDVSQFVGNIINEHIRAEEKTNLYLPGSLSEKNLPDNQPLTVDVTSDIIVASYPKGFYDVVNKFPIVKSGIVASGWGLNFNGKPMFQIDAQLFPGSSGGLVISKPTNIAFINGAVQYSQYKQFVFLGIYSGEYTWSEKIQVDGKEKEIKHSYGLGNVWYSYLVPQIICDGVAFKE